MLDSTAREARVFAPALEGELLSAVAMRAGQWLSHSFSADENLPASVPAAMNSIHWGWES